MIEIRVGKNKDNKETLNAKIDGDMLEVGAEMMSVGEHFANKDKELAEAFIIGMAKSGVYTKENLVNAVISSFEAVELARLCIKFGELDNKLDKNEKKLDKTDKKCENSVEKELKNDKKDDKNDKELLELLNVTALLGGLINLLGDNKDE